MTEAITWTEIKVAIGTLQPWGHNPRTSTKKQAAKILQSWGEFGQVHDFAIGPGLEVYDGHQRLSALLTLHGPGYTVDARQSSRALTEDERKRLVVLLHAGAAHCGTCGTCTERKEAFTLAGIEDPTTYLVRS